MRQIVFVSFLTACVVFAIALVSFFLTESQVQFLDNQLKALSQRLDHTRLLRWYKGLPIQSKQRAFRLICIVLLLINVVIRNVREVIVTGQVRWLLLLVALTTIWITARYSEKATNFLLDGKNFLSLLAKLCMVLVVFLLVIVFFVVAPLVGSFIFADRDPSSLISLVVVLLAAVIAYTVIILTFPLFGYLFSLGLLLLLTSSVLFLLESALAGCRVVIRKAANKKEPWKSLVTVIVATITFAGALIVFILSRQS